MRRLLPQNKNAAAWVLLISALALHVLDEAVTDFLSFYNSMVLDLKHRFGYFPAPIFSFEIWLGGLIAFIIICFLLTPIIKKENKIVKVLVIAFGTLMIANALGHMLGSVLLGKFLPGVWSSPLLLAASVYVVARRAKGEDN